MNTRQFFKGLLAAAGVFALIIALSACDSKTTLAGDLGEDGTYTVTADTARGRDAMLINYDVPEGCTSLTVSSDLASGTLHVTIGYAVGGDSIEEGQISLGQDDVIFTCNASGTDAFTFDIAPGSYSLAISGDNDAPATGTVTISPVK